MNESHKLILLAAALISTVTAKAESEVILDYDYVGAGFLHHDFEFGIEHNAAAVEASYIFAEDFGLQLNSSLGSVSSSQVSGSADAWTLAPSLFYVLRLSDTFHAVPSLGLIHTQADFSLADVDATDLKLGLDLHWEVSPGLQLSIGGHYRDNLDSDLAVGGFNVAFNSGDYGVFYIGAKAAVTERIGIGAKFFKDTEFLDFGLLIGAEYHF